jgi:hypothetical protein
MNDLHSNFEVFASALGQIEQFRVRVAAPGSGLQGSEPALPAGGDVADFT